MHSPPLSTMLLALSISLYLNLDLALATPIPAASAACSSISSIHFLTPRTMSVLGIQRRCNKLWGQEEGLQHKSLLRWAVESLDVMRPLAEPITDEGELYSRHSLNQRRGLEGRPHNPMLPGSSDEGMQEPFEAFVTVEVELVRPKGGLSRAEGQEVLQDDMRIDGLSISRSVRRPHQPWHNTTARKIAASRQRLPLAARQRWRAFERGTREMFVALGSINDGVVTAAAIAIGLVVLILLSIETALGRKRRRVCEEKTVHSKDASRRSSRARYNKRIGGRRYFSRSLDTIPEVEARIDEAQPPDRDLEEKHALMMSLAR